MKRSMFCLAGVLALALATDVFGKDDGDQTPLASNFLYNFYTPPGASTVTAGMYPAPFWSPSLGAQAYYTYQPLMPHEHMYEHRRNYYQSYGGDCSGSYGLNKTTVVWQNGASHVGPLPFSLKCLHGHGHARHHGHCGECQ